MATQLGVLAAAHETPRRLSEARSRLHYTTGDATGVGAARGPKVLAHVVNDAGRWGSGFVMAVSANWPDAAR